MREIHPGRPLPRGATFDGVGVNFAVFSRVATRVEVCLYDPGDPTHETARFDLPEVTGYTWHGYVPGLEPGALYGLRVHGPYAPEQGQRCNPHKLLVDPYAKALCGEVNWQQPVFGYKQGDPEGDLTLDDRDSAAGVPKAVVVSDFFDWNGDHAPEIPWRQTVIYELHVKGFTMLHPEIPEEQRGTYAGLGHPAAIAHLKNLGVTAVELMPVHEHVDDGFLQDKLLRNYWGYSTLGYFAPEQRYASRRTPGAQVSEFKAMVKALHAAGIEVILDVVYNHTCEGNHVGPTLSLRGIDNATYYWLMPEARYYLDFTSTGNSVNASNPEAARLIVDSLRYWVSEMHVDGFRFDLATTIGRVGRGDFDRYAPIFQIINQDPALSRVKLIAEPWDTGLGGYQVGNFPAPWREWNGKFRDALRRYWKGDRNLASEIGYRLTGSADLYLGERRQPQASINFVTAHDGFTLHDLVSFNTKHNEANGEDNRDGADENHGWNVGVEGETDDAEILALRERQKRNLLAGLFVSQGVPMLLAGDEMGRTQGGNNNAYCQDNELSWLDWKLDDRRRRLIDFTRRLIDLRRRHPVLQRRRFFVGDHVWDSQSKDLTWLRPDGTEMTPHDWRKPWLSSLAFMLGGDAIPMVDDRGQRLVGDGLLVLMNPHHQAIRFRLPAGEAEGGEWLLEVDTGDDQKAPNTPASGTYQVAPRALAVFRQPLTAQATRAMPAADRVARTTGEAPYTSPGGAGRIDSDPGRRRRRAGLVIPLFSIRTASSWGAGSINDIPRLARWANQAGFSVLQLLPVNTASGADPSPYAATSAFALDPVFLSIDDCEDFQAAGGHEALPPDVRGAVEALDRENRVNWAGVRAAKREANRLAFGYFLRTEWEAQTARAKQLVAFQKERRSWLDDYALFTVWHDQFGKSWAEWPMGPRDRDPGAVAAARREHQTALLEQAWLQWQLDLQWQKARLETSAAGVELMGDLPFMVSMDSADVWANRRMFRTDLHVGTPPEEGAPEGHDWGLPVYDWVAHQRNDFSWIRGRAARSGELFSIYRIDHAVGFYRTYFRSVDGKSRGFTPADEGAQVRLGEAIMRVMRHWGEVVAEDLGIIPGFLRPSLERLGIPGYRVLRWERDGEGFRDPASWPTSSVATNTTHDTDTTADWFDKLSAGDRAALAKLPGLTNLSPTRRFDAAIRDALLNGIYASPSTLALIPFQDAMGTRERINVPGTVEVTNWTYRMPMTVDALAEDKATTTRLASLAAETDREPEEKP